MCIWYPLVLLSQAKSHVLTHCNNMMITTMMIMMINNAIITPITGPTTLLPPSPPVLGLSIVVLHESRMNTWVSTTN